MRIVDIYSLPLTQNGHVRWNECIGLYSNFIYDNISGQIKYLKYNKNTQKITIYIEKYTDKDGIEIPTNSILYCQLARIFNKSYDFLWEINDSVNDNILIMNKFYKKAQKYYQYKCLKDGYIGEIREDHLKNGSGCPVCKNKKIKVGINDIWTTNPSLAQKLHNKADGYIYTENSSTEVDWDCPYCGNLLEKRKIVNVKNHGLPCCFCNDGFSYPNKFMNNILSQLNIPYQAEYSPEWIKPKRYDFFIPSINLIIEMDGGFHYKLNSDDRIKKMIKRKIKKQ